MTREIRDKKNTHVKHTTFHNKKKDMHQYNPRYMAAENIYTYNESNWIMGGMELNGRHAG